MKHKTKAWLAIFFGIVLTYLFIAIKKNSRYKYDRERAIEKFILNYDRVNYDSLKGAKIIYTNYLFYKKRYIIFFENKDFILESNLVTGGISFSKNCLADSVKPSPLQKRLIEGKLNYYLENGNGNFRYIKVDGNYNYFIVPYAQDLELEFLKLRRVCSSDDTILNGKFYEKYKNNWFIRKAY